MKNIFLMLLFFTSTWLYAIDLNIVDFGAVGNGLTVNTVAIQQAIDSAYNAGGGKVIVPLGGVFISGTIILKSNVELNILGELKGSSSINDYYDIIPLKRSYTDNYPQRSLIYAEYETNITISGNGTLQGNGFSGDFFTNNDDRPYGVRFFSCSNVTYKDLTMRNSGFWMMINFDIDTLTITNLKIFNQSQSNNDGINADGCRNVYIADCLVDSWDDAIVLKTTSDINCENVVVKNCTISSFARVLKIGTETTAGFKNIRFSNILIKKSSFPLNRNATTGINLSIVDGGFMEDVVLDSITIQNGVETPLFVRLGNRARPYSPSVPVTSVGYIRNLTMKNIIGTGIGTITSMITGIPGYYVENVTLRNVTLTMPGGIDSLPYNYTLPENISDGPEFDIFGDSIPAKGLYLRHVKNIVLDNVCFRTTGSDGREWLVYEDVIDSDNTALNFNGIYYCTEDLPNAVHEKLISEFKIYPNPAIDKIYFSLPEGNSYRILYIMNNLGEKINCKIENDVLDVSMLPKGFYFVFAQKGKEVIQQRFILN